MNNFSSELDLKIQSIWHTVESTEEARSNFVYLQEIGLFYANEGYYTTREGLDSFLIKITISGSGVLEYDGNTKVLTPMQFFWIDCMNHQHYCTNPEDGQWDTIWVRFSGATAREYYDAFLKLNDYSPIGTLPDDSPAVKLMEMLINRYPLSGKQDLFEADIYNSSLLTQIMTSCISSIKGVDEVTDIPPVVQNIRSFIDANFDQKLTLQRLAAEFNLDACYLQKLFTRHVGQSPRQYVQQLRLTKAKTLMRSTNKSFSEIAFNIGIDNLCHFTRQFKKVEGMTPTQYRKFWPMM